MRAIKRSEAQVALDALAGPGPGSTDRLPRRTRQTVSQRIASWNWLTERWVPSAALFPESRLTFSLFAPFVDRRAEARRRWASTPEAIVVWATEGHLFGVFATTGPAATRPLLERLEDPALGSPTIHLTADADAASLPVWFDFGGAWAHLTSLEVPSTYPRGLAGRGSSHAPEPSPEPTAADRAAIGRLVRTGDGPERDPGVSAGGLEERAVRRGWVAARTFLNPWSIAQTAREFPSQIAFLFGRIRPVVGREPLGSPQGIIGPVRPFLLVRGPTEVLIGTLSRGPSGGRDAPRGSGGPVLRQLGDHLDQIRVVREPLANLRPLVHHRYSPLITVSDAFPSASDGVRLPGENLPATRIYSASGRARPLRS